MTAPDHMLTASKILHRRGQPNMHVGSQPSGRPFLCRVKGAIFGARKKKFQIERFKEAARKLGTDDDEQRFNERLRELAMQKPDGKPDDKG